MDWPRILAYITGTVDQELLLRNEYLVAENRILKEQVNGRLLLSDGERKTLAEIGYRLGRKTLEDVANAAKPDTILGWYRKLVAQKFDGSKARRKVGRPQVDDDIEQLIVPWPGRIAAGAMTGLWAPWPILATGFQIRP
jgi:putative transposase